MNGYQSASFQSKEGTYPKKIMLDWLQGWLNTTIDRANFCYAEFNQSYLLPAQLL